MYIGGWAGVKSNREIVSCRAMRVCVHACVRLACSPCDIILKTSATQFPFPFFLWVTFCFPLLMRISVSFPLWGHIKLKSEWNQCDFEVILWWWLVVVAGQQVGGGWYSVGGRWVCWVVVGGHWRPWQNLLNAW